jgi:hypothetical protein
MKIHIEPKDDMTVFDLSNIFRLNYDAIDTSFCHIDIKHGDEDDNNLETEKISVLTVEPKFNEDDGKYDIQRKVEKIMDTIKLAYKLGVIK